MPGQGSALDDDWGALLGVQLSRNIDLETTSRRGLLPPGVVDTRPRGVKIVDVRDGVRLPEGVVDTRSHSIAAITATPPSPFRADPAPAGEHVVLDVDTLRVRRVVDDALPTVVTTAAPIPAAMPEPADELTPPTVSIQVATPAPADLPADAPTAKAATSPYMRRSEMRRLEARASRRSSGSLSVPQVGIASALGLATIAAPLSGALTAPSQAGANQLASSSSALVVATPAKAEVSINFPQTVPAAKNAVEAARVVVDDKQVGAVPAALAPPSRLLVTRVSRGNEGRAVLPGCDGVLPDGAKSAANGRLPASALCSLWDKDQNLRADAAVTFAKMNVAYKQEFGKDICVTDSYRTLNEQYTVKALRGGYAAAPGTSEHGWGLAVDLCGGSSVAGTPTFTWLRANADRYGWENPDWAHTSLYEPWHWEWSPGRDG